MKKAAEKVDEEKLVRSYGRAEPISLSLPAIQPKD